MAEHFTQATEETTQWCNHCGRPTQHAVSAGRIGHCLAHNAPMFSKTQLHRRALAERERQNPRLFE